MRPVSRHVEAFSCLGLETPRIYCLETPYFQSIYRLNPQNDSHGIDVATFSWLSYGIRQILSRI